MIKQIEVKRLASIVRKYGDNRLFHNVGSPFVFPEFAGFLWEKEDSGYLAWMKAHHPKWTPEQAKKSVLKHSDLYKHLQSNDCPPVQIWGVDGNFSRVQLTKFNFDGYHRLTAYQVLGKKTIPCKIGGRGNQDA